MICNFCKISIEDAKTSKIVSPDDESVSVCPECMNDILELMESGILEDKTYKNYESILEIDNGYLFEPLANGRKRTFKNCKVLRVEPQQRDKYRYSSNANYRYYDDRRYPYEVLIELMPRERFEELKYPIDYSAQLLLKP